VSIHAEHPFLPPEGERDPLRRLRGRVPAGVSVWTAAAGGRRAGWTVSSFLLADGDPAELVGLVDEEAELVELLASSSTLVVNLLSWEQRFLADAFAGLAPAPGGPFRLASWDDTSWGPALGGAVGWLGARLSAPLGQHAGWGLLVRAEVQHVELANPDSPVLASFRGRYRPVDASPPPPPPGTNLRP
jgi:flavin reductase (DIM6/NTAB) family NADH-FMN oxidoreductase RutF